MADGGIPNKIRAESALTIYRDAMRQHVDSILERKYGPKWILEHVLNERARVRDESGYNERLQSLETGSASRRSLIDLADIHHLIQRNRDVFRPLGVKDVDLMRAIYELRNRSLGHPGEGDCTRGEAEALAGLCIHILERCDLPKEAKKIPSLMSAVPAVAVPETDLQKEREERARREWDRKRLSVKPPEELTAQERERLNDYEWQEEWERLEQERERQERERLERERLEQERERQERERLERERQKRQERLERQERERLEQERLERERQKRERLEQKRLEQKRKERQRRAQDLGGRLSAGGVSEHGHSLGLHEDGTVVGWGWNEHGQCDAPAGKFVAISAGWRHSLGLREDGTVVGWGTNGDGQCDAPAGKFVAVSAGGRHSLGLREDGTVVGWGWNEHGQRDAPAGKFVAVSAGVEHSLGLREDGTVVGWGWNEHGQCDAPAGKFVAVNAGWNHSLGLREDGTVVGWGWNRYGQCDAPAGKFVAVNAGWSHSLGLREDGTVVGWGWNKHGQRDAPAGEFVAVSAGDCHSLGLREDGTAVGWGITRKASATRLPNCGSDERLARGAVLLEMRGIGLIVYFCYTYARVRHSALAAGMTEGKGCWRRGWGGGGCSRRSTPRLTSPLPGGRDELGEEWVWGVWEGVGSCLRRNDGRGAGMTVGSRDGGDGKERGNDGGVSAGFSGGGCGALSVRRRGGRWRACLGLCGGRRRLRGAARGRPLPASRTSRAAPGWSPGRAGPGRNG